MRLQVETGHRVAPPPVRRLARRLLAARVRARAVARRRCSRRPASTSRAWTGPTCGSAEPRRAPRPGSCSSRSTAPGSTSSGTERLPGARRLPRHEPAHAARAPGVGRRRRALRPRARPRSRPRARRAFVNDVTEGAVVAFDTELFGHHWHEGVTFLERVLELADVVPVAVERRGDAPADVAAHELGHRPRPAHVERARRGGWRGPSAAPSCRAGRRRRPRARCASCSRCRARTGRSRSRTRAPATTRASAPRRISRRSSRRCAGRKPRSCEISRRSSRIGHSSSPELKARRRRAEQLLRRCVECRRA